MSMFFKTKECEQIFFNNVALTKVYFNQVLVWANILTTYTITYQDTSGNTTSQKCDDVSSLKETIQNLNNSGVKTLTIQEEVATND